MDPEQGQAQTGERFGAYTIERHLGPLGFTERYEAVDSHGERLSMDILMVYGRRLGRTLREAGLVGRFDHENVVSLRDIAEDGRSAALVCDLYTGTDLRTWIADTEPDLAERIRVFRQVVRGVEHLHQQGVCHLDLRSQGLVVSRRTGSPVPQITHAGLAQQLYLLVEQGDGSVSSSGGMQRTRQSAPEVIRQPRNADGRADLYSLGCILYELVCGVDAFEGLNYYANFVKKRDEDYTLPSRHCPDIPQDLEDIIVDLLRADPDARIQNCSDLRQRLDAANLAPSVRGPPDRSLAAPPMEPDAEDEVVDLLWFGLGVGAAILAGFALVLLAMLL